MAEPATEQPDPEPPEVPPEIANDTERESAETVSSAEMPRPRHVQIDAAVRDVAERGAEAAEVVASRSVIVAQAAMTRVKNGIDRAKRRIEQNRADWERVTKSSQLPAVHAGDPMSDLAVRLDREASFWRAFALRSIKPGVPQLIAIVAACLGLVGGAGLAALGGLRGLFGSAASAPTLWASAGALATGVVLAVLAAWWLHRSASKAAADALARADSAERRLARVAAILALKSADESAYKEALVRLERG